MVEVWQELPGYDEGVHMASEQENRDVGSSGDIPLESPKKAKMSVRVASARLLARENAISVFSKAAGKLDAEARETRQDISQMVGPEHLGDYKQIVIERLALHYVITKGFSVVEAEGEGKIRHNTKTGFSCSILFTMLFDSVVCIALCQLSASVLRAAQRTQHHHVAVPCNN